MKIIIILWHNVPLRFDIIVWFWSCWHVRSIVLILWIFLQNYRTVCQNPLMTGKYVHWTKTRLFNRPCLSLTSRDFDHVVMHMIHGLAMIFVPIYFKVLWRMKKYWTGKYSQIYNVDLWSPSLTLTLDGVRGLCMTRRMIMDGEHLCQVWAHFFILLFSSKGRETISEISESVLLSLFTTPCTSWSGIHH